MATANVPREVFLGRMRMATTSTRKVPGDQFPHVDSSPDSDAITEAIGNLMTRIIEDGLHGDDEIDAAEVFIGEIEHVITERIIDFAWKVENVIRPAAWAKRAAS